MALVRESGSGAGREEGPVVDVLVAVVVVAVVEVEGVGRSARLEGASRACMAPSHTRRVSASAASRFRVRPSCREKRVNTALSLEVAPCVGVCVCVCVCACCVRLR